MYCGFNFDSTDLDLEKLKNQYYHSGLEMLEKHKSIIIHELDTFSGINGSLNATEIQQNWFPQITADIFISHSHSDEDLAISLAGFLKVELNLTSFIDSCVWGYCDTLQNLIDLKYCYKKSTDTYSYKKRNNSTSHVHMILSTALSMMIDSTECLFFINSPNSITPRDTITDPLKTYSPWIFSEIFMSKFIRKRDPIEHRKIILKSSKALVEMEDSLKIEYDLDTSHLYEINVDDIIEWQDNLKNQNQHPLDVLYSQILQGR